MKLDFKRVLSPIPRQLYKYHKLTLIDLYSGKTDLHPYFLSLINKAEFHLSNHNELNDPNDGRYYMTDTFLKQITDRTYEYLVEQGLEDSFKDELKETGAKSLNDGLSTLLEDSKFKNMFMNFISDKNFARICCFSEDGNNKLMWGHYADSYNGVCLEFDFFKSNSILPYLKKIE